MEGHCSGDFRPKRRKPPHPSRSAGALPSRPWCRVAEIQHLSPQMLRVSGHCHHSNVMIRECQNHLAAQFSQTTEAARSVMQQDSHGTESRCRCITPSDNPSWSGCVAFTRIFIVLSFWGQALPRLRDTQKPTPLFAAKFFPQPRMVCEDRPVCLPLVDASLSSSYLTASTSWLSRLAPQPAHLTGLRASAGAQ